MRSYSIALIFLIAAFSSESTQASIDRTKLTGFLHVRINKSTEPFRPYLWILAGRKQAIQPGHTHFGLLSREQFENRLSMFLSEERLMSKQNQAAVARFRELMDANSMRKAHSNLPALPIELDVSDDELLMARLKICFPGACDLSLTDYPAAEGFIEITVERYNSQIAEPHAKLDDDATNFRYSVRDEL